MIVQFEHKNKIIKLAIFGEMYDKNNKNHRKLKAFRRFGVSPQDTLSSRIYRKKMFYDLSDLELSLNFMNGDLIIDCGANIGNHTVFWSCFTFCPILSIEPFEKNYELLKENCALNKCDRVRLSRSLLSDKISLFKSKSTSKGRGKTSYSPSIEGDQKSCLLDNLVGSDVVGFIKVDVEGMEIDVLNGSHRILKEFHPIIFIEAHASFDPLMDVKVRNLLSDYGYKQGVDLFCTLKQQKRRRKNNEL